MAEDEEPKKRITPEDLGLEEVFDKLADSLGVTRPVYHYVLDAEHNPRPVLDLFQWEDFCCNIENRQVGSTILKGVRVSTVFLGIDHAFGGGQPVLFETMVFPAKGKKFPEKLKAFEDFQERYCTWAEAVAGHAAVVEEIKAH